MDNENPQKKRKWLIIILAVIVLGATFSVPNFMKKKTPRIPIAETVTEVKLINVNDYKKGQESISAEGTVESSNQADIKSQASAQIEKINVSVGDTVKSGQVLINLSSKDYQAQLAQTEALLESARAQTLSAGKALMIQNAKLTQLLKGARAEEVAISETAVNSAKQTLVNAQTALANAQTKAVDDMNSALDGAVTGMGKSIITAMSALNTITDIQYSRFRIGGQERILIASKKADAIESFLGQTDAGEWTYQFISKLDSGVKAEIENISPEPTEDEVLQLLTGLEDSLNKIKDALDVIPQSPVLTASDIANLVSAKTAISAEISTISAKQQLISALINSNESAISTAQSRVEDAKNGLLAAQNALALKKAKARPEDVEMQKAAVEQTKVAVMVQQALIKQAQANVNNIITQIGKTVIIAPFDGTISAIVAREGELASIGMTLISIVDASNLNIKSYISEQDFSFIEKGLVAEGSDVLIDNEFKGTINHIAPSVDLKTRKIEVDIKPIDPNARLIIGQNVSVDLLAKHEKASPSVFILPLEAISISQDGNFVYEVGKNSTLEQKSVVLGDVTGEKVEVKSGLTQEMSIVSPVSGLKPGQKVTVQNFNI